MNKIEKYLQKVEEEEKKEREENEKRWREDSMSDAQANMPLRFRGDLEWDEYLEVPIFLASKNYALIFRSGNTWQVIKKSNQRKYYSNHYDFTRALKSAVELQKKDDNGALSRVGNLFDGFRDWIDGILFSEEENSNG